MHDKTTTPYQKLNGVELVYTALRVFGCGCYPYLRPYGQNKIDPKSIFCVFVGYTEKYKGYRCLHPPTGRVYISRHVVFDENRFPYADVYKHLLPQASTPLLSAWYKGCNDSSEPILTEAESSGKEPVLSGKRHQQLPNHQPEANLPAPAPFLYAEENFPPLPSPDNQQAPVHKPVQAQELTSDGHKRKSWNS